MAFGRDDVCEHGSLERKCEICDRDKRIAELEAEIASIRSGNVVVIPTTRGHAAAMHLIAGRWLLDNPQAAE